jgi:PEP-CTERM motif
MPRVKLVRSAASAGVFLVRVASALVILSASAVASPLTFFGYEFEDRDFADTFVVVSGAVTTSDISPLAAVRGPNTLQGVGLQFNAVVDLTWTGDLPANGAGFDLAIFTVNAVSGLPQFRLAFQEPGGSFSSYRLINFDHGFFNGGDVALALVDFADWGVQAVTAMRVQSLSEFENVVPGGNAEGVNPSYLDLIGALHTVAAPAVPEPPSYVLALVGLGVVVFAARRSKRALHGFEGTA